MQTEQERRIVLKNMLEGIIDIVGLPDTLEMLAEICFEKAEHVATNWQDTPSAKKWIKDGNRIDDLVFKIEG